MSQPHVVIVGGGFGGLDAARALRAAPVRVTLVDRRNHHVFQPLLYQVATAGLSPGDIAAPIRWVLRRQQNVHVLLADAVRIDPAARRVILDVGDLEYDYLILSPGAEHSYFGHDDWANWAPGLKTLDDALAIRRKLLLAYEAAEREDDPDVRRRLLTFVIVGGGPTGVELAGALAEIARHTLRHDFRRIRPESARVLLIEAGPALLSAFPEDLRAFAERALERLGVEVRKNAPITELGPSFVAMRDERIEAATILWAAGVAASPLGAWLGAPLDRAGRVAVEPDLSVPGRPEVFVIGDLALFTHQGGAPLPGVAPVAMQQGRWAAENVARLVGGRPTSRFRYVDKGNMATIGRAAAIADFGSFRLTGFVAWLSWLFIHILFLIGFRSRALVMIQWAWAYLTYQRSARLIVGERAAVPAGGGERPAASASRRVS
jgi:NADH dehydrogenase